MELVFKNCRVYNGTESFVGKIGVDVNREYDNLLQAYGLKERFEQKVDTDALVAEILNAQNYNGQPANHQPHSNGYSNQHRDMNGVEEIAVKREAGSNHNSHAQPEEHATHKAPVAESQRIYHNDVEDNGAFANSNHNSQPRAQEEQLYDNQVEDLQQHNLDQANREGYSQIPRTHPEVEHQNTEPLESDQNGIIDESERVNN